MLNKMLIRMIKILNFKWWSFKNIKIKNIPAKGYTANCSEETFVIKKIKNTVPRTYVINSINGAEII